MDKSDWEVRLTRTIADQVRLWRGKRRLSLQRLADRTAELTGPIPRNVLANFESRRRDTLSVGELFILAKALDAAPVDLLFPAEADAEIEIAPGEFLSRERAVTWLATPHCLTCDGEPPAGFTCETCGKSGTTAAS